MNKQSIEVPEWWTNTGGMSYRRDALPSEHPESIWNFVRKNYPDVDPREYNIEAPKTKMPDECPCCGYRLS